jgi:hypothetical protein
VAVMSLEEKVYLSEIYIPGFWNQEVLAYQSLWKLCTKYEANKIVKQLHPVLAGAVVNFNHGLLMIIFEVHLCTLTFDKIG